eukprot:COSAG06_NODE_71_length_25945_cov_9.124468_5_plen_324_part_00
MKTQQADRSAYDSHSDAAAHDWSCVNNHLAPWLLWRRLEPQVTEEENGLSVHRLDDNGHSTLPRQARDKHRDHSIVMKQRGSSLSSSFQLVDGSMGATLDRKVRQLPAFYDNVSNLIRYDVSFGRLLRHQQPQRQPSRQLRQPAGTKKELEVIPTSSSSSSSSASASPSSSPSSSSSSASSSPAAPAASPSPSRLGAAMPEGLSMSWQNFFFHLETLRISDVLGTAEYLPQTHGRVIMATDALMQCAHTQVPAAPGNIIWSIYAMPLRFKLDGRPILSGRINVETARSVRNRPMTALAQAATSSGRRTSMSMSLLTAVVCTCT